MATASSLPEVSPRGPVVSDLRVEQGSSLVPMVARGPAADALVRENRSLRHNVWEPTGRFVRSGELVTVDIPAGVTTAIAGVGTWGGVYASLNDGKDLNGLVAKDLKPGINRFPAQRDGMVFLRSTAGGPFDATVSGGSPSPVYIAGKTTNIQLRERMERFPDSPFVTVIGERVVADLQRHLAEQEVARITDERVAIWEKTVALTDEVYGLDYAAEGLHNRSLGRLFLSNPDSGSGYANAWHDRLSFQNSTGAGRDLLTRDALNMWGLWHEVGHTYQTPQYTSWGGVEVTVNISSLAIQEALGGASRIEDTATLNKVAKFRETPVDERSFSTASDVWLRLVMFDQLRRGFGEQFYPELSRAYREQVDARTLPPTSTNAQQEQVFIQMASTVANRNLTPFFAQWGIWPDAQTTAIIGTLPTLKQEIWNNLNRATDVVEYRVNGPATRLGVYDLAVTSDLFDIFVPGASNVLTFYNQPKRGAVGFLAVQGESWSQTISLPSGLIVDPDNLGSCRDYADELWSTTCIVDTSGSSITLTHTRIAPDADDQFVKRESVSIGVIADGRDSLEGVASVLMTPAPSDISRTDDRTLEDDLRFGAVPTTTITGKPGQTRTAEFVLGNGSHDEAVVIVAPSGTTLGAVTFEGSSLRPEYNEDRTRATLARDYNGKTITVEINIPQHPLANPMVGSAFNTDRAGRPTYRHHIRVYVSSPY